MFKVGEKVVCIEPTLGLVKNEIYTVAQMVVSNFGNPGVYLLEVKPPDPFFVGFQARRFRKLDYEFAENLLAEIKESVMQNVN